MRFCMNRIFIISSIALIVMMGALNSSETYGENNITMTDLLGIWHQYSDIPWAIQFNEDGTFRSAHTVLRLEKVSKDEGRFQLEGTSLTLISNDDFEGSCKGLEGRYKVEIIEYGRLLLKEQEDQCLERKEVCSSPWIKVLH